MSGRGSAWRRILAFGSTFAAAASPILAAPLVGGGHSGVSSTSYMSREEALNDLGGFGRCYGPSHKAMAFAFLATTPGSHEEAEQFRGMFRKGEQACLGSTTQLGAPVAFVRGAIAEGLYRGRIAPPDTLVRNFARDAPIRTISDTARCYTAEHRAEVEQLVRFSAGGRKEYDAVQRMLPGVATCLPPGMKVEIDPTRLRYALAEALYRAPDSDLASAGK